MSRKSLIRGALISILVYIAIWLGFGWKYHEVANESNGKEFIFQQDIKVKSQMDEFNRKLRPPIDDPIISHAWDDAVEGIWNEKEPLGYFDPNRESAVKGYGPWFGASKVGGKVGEMLDRPLGRLWGKFCGARFAAAGAEFYTVDYEDSPRAKGQIYQKVETPSDVYIGKLTLYKLPLDTKVTPHMLIKTPGRPPPREQAEEMESIWFYSIFPTGTTPADEDPDSKNYYFNILFLEKVSSRIITALDDSPHTFREVQSGRFTYPKADFLYFSAVTIATVGYGDILPNSSRVRILVTIESALGVIFIGVFISFFFAVLSSSRKQGGGRAWWAPKGRKRTHTKNQGRKQRNRHGQNQRPREDWAKKEILGQALIQSVTKNRKLVIVLGIFIVLLLAVGLWAWHRTNFLTGVLIRPFDFETVRTDTQGQIVERRKGQAQYFVENLGNGVSLGMVLVPSGKFTMGSPNNEFGRRSSEGPQHLVRIREFAIGKFEVTQAQWREVAKLPKERIDINPELQMLGEGDPKNPTLPIGRVSWYAAVEFCERLARKTGRPYRLPSEAEWEYACRAGTTAPYAFGDTITPQFVNFNGNISDPPQPQGVRGGPVSVGSFGVANAFGIYDMPGNIWEWCQDAMHKNYNGAPNDGSAWMKGGTQGRVLRGGSWVYNDRDCRSACRTSFGPGLDFNGRSISDEPPGKDYESPNNFGFRVALSARSFF